MVSLLEVNIGWMKNEEIFEDDCDQNVEIKNVRYIVAYVVFYYGLFVAQKQLFVHHDQSGQIEPCYKSNIGFQQVKDELIKQSLPS